MAQQGAQIHFGPQPPPGFTRRTHSQPAAAGGHNARIPSPAPAQPPVDPAAAFQHHHQNMSNWLGQIQREAMARAIVHQNQRGRAHMGMRGIGDTPGGPNYPGGNPADPNGGRASPAPTHTVYRETVGPNGHSYHVETVIRPGGPVPPGQQNGLSPVEVQNILRGADANQATAAMTSAMQRSASGASTQSRPLNQPGVTTPMFGPGAPATASGRATPDLSTRSAIGAGQFAMPAGHQATPSRQGMEVYILSSPEGPRALLLNNNTSETYFTPRLRIQNSMPHLRTAASFSNLAYAATQPHTPQSNYQQHLPQQQNQPMQQQQQQQQEQQHRNNGQMMNNHAPAPVAGQQPALHPANPPAAGIPPLLLQAWPHIWLIFRLAVFVWLFTSPNSSWSRWFTVICLAILVFLLSTGILNGVAANTWRPIGRHLENLLPTPEQHVRGQQPLPRGPAAPGEQEPLVQTGELDPAQMAARLVAQRDRQSWFTTQVRRLERAGLLFLASIAPGVAERHIANLEAEARAEEARRREAEAAAAAAAAAAEAERNASNGEESQMNDENTGDSQVQGDTHDVERQEEPRGNVGGDGIREELIAL